MSTVAINRLQDRLEGQWMTGASGFLVENRPARPARRNGHPARPLRRISLRPSAGVTGEVQAQPATAHATFAVQVAKTPRLPVPALEPPDRAEGRLTLTIGILAAGALWEVLRATGGLVAGWDRFVELAARLMG